MKSPISLQVLSRLSVTELQALIRGASQVLDQKQGRVSAEQSEHEPNHLVNQADNLFDLLKKAKVSEGDIAKAWNKRYHVWQRMRLDVKKLSVERIEQLANAMGVSPASLFDLILNCYPEQEGKYNFDAYRLPVKKDLDELIIIKKS